MSPEDDGGEGVKEDFNTVSTETNLVLTSITLDDDLSPVFEIGHLGIL